MTKELDVRSVVHAIPSVEEELKIGVWYWVKDRHKDWNEDLRDYEYSDYEWLGCITTIGSNYVKLTHAEGGTSRIHIDQFDDRCRIEPDAEQYIANEVAEKQRRVNELMGDVRRITASLSIPVRGALLPPSSETSALIHVGSSQNFDDYKTSLIAAKKEKLPKIFEEIKETNAQLAKWMAASLIPLQAEAEMLKPAIAAIETRIFNVDLYAGLSEEVKLIKDGEPAGLTEKLTLFQRMAFMDEECLADYEKGGMDFKKIEQFDKWLIKRKNLDRVLPAQRSIVAFRVRRNEKHRTGWTYKDFVRIDFERDMDKMTFLYIRNGERVYRLNTSIEFDEKLFPDLSRVDTTHRLYVRMFAGRVDKFMDEHEYDVTKAEWDRHQATRSKAEDQFGYPKKCLCRTEEGLRYCRFRSASDNPVREYIEFNDDTVYYDDIKRHLDEEMLKHNRIVIVLQGLLDRSPVLQPHPPYRLSTPEGFSQAVRLIYDEDKALTSGEAPDFEEYRQRLNASLKTGSVTVGQDYVWEVREAVRENARRRASHGYGQGYYEVETYRPYGDPGPGSLARVVRFNKTKKVCTFKWTRKAQRGRWINHDWTYPQVPCSMDVPADKLLNVDAYVPGDYHIFFDDPRTRADYLQWAPLLLEAEEWHAGNRKLNATEEES